MLLLVVIYSLRGQRTRIITAQGMLGNAGRTHRQRMNKCFRCGSTGIGHGQLKARERLTPPDLGASQC